MQSRLQVFSVLTYFQLLNLGVLRVTAMVPNEDNIGVKARTVLWYLTFVGFAVNYMIRINASISIVDMIDGNFKRSSNASDLMSECITNETFNVITNGSSVGEFFSTTTQLSQPMKHVSVERKLLDYLEVIWF